MIWEPADIRYEEKRPFGGHMTPERFSKKYWLDGIVPYQYHTMHIEDGETEKEQLIINNVRALKNSSVMLRRIMAEKMKEKQEQIDKNKKRIRLLMAAVVVCGIATDVRIRKGGARHGSGRNNNR